MTAHDYDRWPDGTDERHVRQCNCTTCEAIDHLYGNDVEHDALDDALHQARIASAALDRVQEVTNRD